MGKLSYDEIQKIVYEEYRRNGYDEMFNKHGLIGDIAELGLICTEVSEAIEKVRTNALSIEEELADIVIRVMNYCNRKCICLRPVILWKNEQNLKRSRLHGKVV